MHIDLVLVQNLHVFQYFVAGRDYSMRKWMAALLLVLSVLFTVVGPVAAGSASAATPGTIVQPCDPGLDPIWPV